MARPQDLAKKGRGRLFLEDRVNAPMIITGVDTAFTQELQVGWAITLPHDRGTFAVESIEDDYHLTLRKPVKDLGALELLTSPMGTPFKTLPHIDQHEVYDAVHDRLNAGECIGIFPEGGSHDRAEMLPFKAGVTVMALGAMSANESLRVQIVPVGLNYFHPDKFRSRAVIEFGDPIQVDKESVRQYKEGGDAKREACAKLLDLIYTRLRSITVNCRSYEELMVIQAARRLYRPPTHYQSKRQKRRRPDTTRSLRLTRRLVAGYEHFEGHPEVQALRSRVLEYNKTLSYFGIRDHQVPRAQLGPRKAGILLAHRLLTLLILGAIALPGAVLNAPIFVAAHVISRHKAKQALAASSVKIKGRDVLATWKVMVTLFFVPTIYWMYAGITLWYAIRQDWSLSWMICGPLLVWVVMPTISYLSLIFGERSVDIYRSLRPLSLQVIPWTRSQVMALPSQREKLSQDITDLINTLGPELYPDWSTRMFRPPPPPGAESADDAGTGGGWSSGGGLSGVATPSLVSLRGWIRTPLELLDGVPGPWEWGRDSEGVDPSSMTRDPQDNNKDQEEGKEDHHHQAESSESQPIDLILTPDLPQGEEGTGDQQDGLGGGGELRRRRPGRPEDKEVEGKFGDTLTVPGWPSPQRRLGEKEVKHEVVEPGVEADVEEGGEEDEEDEEYGGLVIVPREKAT